MNAYFKFACIYCGQHMKCEPRFRGSQMLCPACFHRIVIPIMRVCLAPGQPPPARHDWDTWVPMAQLETPPDASTARHQIGYWPPEPSRVKYSPLAGL